MNFHDKYVELKAIFHFFSGYVFFATKPSLLRVHCVVISELFISSSEILPAISADAPLAIAVT